MKKQKNDLNGPKSKQDPNGSAAGVPEVEKPAVNIESQTVQPGTPDAISKELTQEEKTALRVSERTIKKCLRGGWELAEALDEIAERRLYRAKFKTFRHYCQKRWQLSDRRVRQIIDALRARKRLATAIDEKHLPRTECQVRPLVLLKEADLQVQAWRQALGKTNRQPTGREVKKVVKTLLPEATRPQVDTVTGLIANLKRLQINVAGVNGPAANYLRIVIEALQQQAEVTRQDPGKAEPVSQVPPKTETGKVDSSQSAVRKGRKTEQRVAA